MTKLGSILITGTSSGLGEALAAWALDQGHRVLGTSRRGNPRLSRHDSYFEVLGDLAHEQSATETIERLTKDMTDLELVVLNAGILSTFGDLADTELEDLERTMRINVFANQTVLRTLARSGCMPARVVAISSGAAVNGRRGWGGYALSKAALNMLIQLWARECPQSHFCALAPGLIDTAMQDVLCDLPGDERFDSLEFLRSARHTADMPDPSAAAERLGPLLFELEHHCESGGYVDVRGMA
ncbi:MAG: SDR family NAD(P)-dependent oxidoreductase [Planctomycetes bacterium]|nr:SDR family NAD(P)-dependent oxidoreductase [Planctomycetota bacterium]MCB9890344.1 SDR family NAD(P)-dependent oxidoreductase [Planctomycetota bacterium]MCB9918162.1 SDR family NAD(P)-dependent oxidoreductase [Planctomycetota bacterium]